MQKQYTIRQQKKIALKLGTTFFKIQKFYLKNQNCDIGFCILVRKK